MPKYGSEKFPAMELLRSLAPITRMGKVMMAGLVVWFINWAFASDQTLFGSEFLKKLIDFASVLAVIPLIYFAIKSARWATQRLLWRLRRRLIVTYLLIGALPLLLLILLIVSIGYVAVMQSSLNLVGRQLDGYQEQSRAAALALGSDLERWDLTQLPIEELRRRLQERANSLAPVFPDLTLSVRRNGVNGFAVAVSGRSSEGDGASPAAPLDESDPAPPWLAGRGEYHGLVVDESAGQERRVRMRHIIKLNHPEPVYFHLSYPLGENLCEHLRHTTQLVVKPSQVLTPLVMTESGARLDQSEARSSNSGEPGRESSNWLWKSFPIFKPAVKWSTGKEMQCDVVWIDLSFLQPSQIFRQVQQFKSGSAIGNALVWMIGGLGIFFLIIALVAIISAVFLTRSITGAVHHLYTGTKFVETGNFDHEIPIRSRDQLGELSGSFNQMTRSIRELLRVSAEKQRLDQEMEIAAKVQSRLFPRSVPNSERLDFAPGVCIPARAVSGDYYDYLDVAPGVLGVVVADVCGKGVSAALMMANLQANLRGQVQAYHDAYSMKLTLAASAEAQTGDRASSAHPVQRIIQRVNQQVADSVIDATFITLFYAEFDERNLTLRYTNAGHNPPLLVRLEGGKYSVVERLERGGTVLGLFRDFEYEDAEIKLNSGDLLVAFTDGLVEAHNAGNEEFGEERVIQTLLANGYLSAAEIETRLLQSVKAWTSGAEQEDDLTLVIFKVK